MLVTCAALLPALGVSAVFNGPRVLAAAAVSILSAVAAEWIFRAAAERRPVSLDGSACLTGLLLSLTFPPQVPLWVPPAGAVFSIIIVKMACGGLGRNFLNPALAGRAFCALLFPAVFNTAQSFPALVPGETLFSLALGHQGGWIGTSSAGALLIGAAALRTLSIVDLTLPLSFIGAASLLSLTAGSATEALAQVGSSGIVLCAFFMATDPCTSPKRPAPRLLYGACCGFLSIIFFDGTGAGNGVVFAVLIMNCMVPLFDRFPGRSRRRAAGKRAAQ
jgi:electron transport complex protein RnfD